jgi:hypothetical protein
MGLSYERALVLPRAGKYYFDANDKALVNTFPFHCNCLKVSVRAERSAQTDITLGGAPIDAQGVWAGQRKAAETGTTQNPVISVAPTSATIVHFLSSK